MSLNTLHYPGCLTVLWQQIMGCSYQNRTAASVAQTRCRCESLKSGQEVMQCNEQQCRFVYWFKELNQHLPALRAGVWMAILQALSQATCTQYNQFLKNQTWMSRSQKKFGWRRELFLTQNNMDRPQFKCQLLRKLQLNHLKNLSKFSRLNATFAAQKSKGTVRNPSKMYE